MNKLGHIDGGQCTLGSRASVEIVPAPVDAVLVEPRRGEMVATVPAVTTMKQHHVALYRVRQSLKLCVVDVLEGNANAHALDSNFSTGTHTLYVLGELRCLQSRPARGRWAACPRKAPSGAIRPREQQNGRPAARHATSTTTSGATSCSWKPTPARWRHLPGVHVT